MQEKILAMLQEINPYVDIVSSIVAFTEKTIFQQKNQE